MGKGHLLRCPLPRHNENILICVKSIYLSRQGLDLRAGPLIVKEYTLPCKALGPLLKIAGIQERIIQHFEID